MKVLAPSEERLAVRLVVGVVKSTNSLAFESIRVSVADSPVNVPLLTAAVKANTRLATFRLSVIGASPV